jgi:predicted O-methyltransferase YrrM
LTPEEVLKSIEEEAATKGFPIIGPVRGAILDEALLTYRPRRILEVGTLVGYSAIRMARLLGSDGAITCIDIREDMASVARSNLARAGLAEKVKVKVGDASKVIPTLEGHYDMVFLDAAKDEYLGYLMASERMMSSGGVVVADNVKSFSGELRDYLDYVRRSGRYRSTYRESLPSPWQTEGDAVEISVRV